MMIIKRGRALYTLQLHTCVTKSMTQLSLVFCFQPAGNHMPGPPPVALIIITGSPPHTPLKPH